MLCPARKDSRGHGFDSGKDVRRLQSQLFAHLRAIGGTWQQQKPFEIALDASTAIPGNGFLGVEIRQSILNQHGFFSGRALFVGPSLFFRLSKAIVVKVAWEAQIPAETGGRADLVNYERQEFRVQFAWNF